MQQAHMHRHTHLCVKKAHSHRGTLVHAHFKRQYTFTDTLSSYNRTNTYKHENNLFFKKRQEQMIQIKRAKLRVGMCLHSLTTF